MPTNAAHTAPDVAPEPRDAADHGAVRRSLFETGVPVAIAVLLVVDLVADAAGPPFVHATIEAVATAFAVMGAGRLWLRWLATRRALQRRVDELRARLHAASVDAERWRKEALEGLGVLLLKGLSMKEIAEARGTTERTARQQADRGAQKRRTSPRPRSCQSHEAAD